VAEGSLSVGLASDRTPGTDSDSADDPRGTPSCEPRCACAAEPAAGARALLPAAGPAPPSDPATAASAKERARSAAPASLLGLQAAVLAAKSLLGDCAALRPWSSAAAETSETTSPDTLGSLLGLHWADLAGPELLDSRETGLPSW